MKNLKGTVFNIQSFSVHDGPGIRTVVFLKGCPLRCPWCGNPESQSPHCEVAWSAGKCIGCGNCLSTLPDAASKEPNGRITVHGELTRSQAEWVCPTGALHVLGEEKSVREVLDLVEKDRIFYSNSEGGMTLSGGEPLWQRDYTLALLQEAQARHIHCAMETTGFADFAVLHAAAKRLDFMLYDIKTMDDAKHRKYIGSGNRLILENFKLLKAEFPSLPVVVRTPVIPGFNDSREDIGAILDFLASYPDVQYELLPYHRLGEPKYEALGRPYPMGRVVLNAERMQSLKKLAERRMPIA